MTIRICAILLLALACREPQPQAQVEPNLPEPEPVAVTRWTERTELFMEYSPLSAGEPSRFAVHLTDLESFQPLRHGRVEVILQYGAADAESPSSFSVDAPIRPGIFVIDVVPRRRGMPAMSVAVRSPGLKDTHHLGATIVHANLDELELTPPSEDISTGITFLKEQQWTMDFATEAVSLDTIRKSLLVPATVEVRGGGRVTVLAPVSGRLLPSTLFPVIGTVVSDGQQLGGIVPTWTGSMDLPGLQLALDQTAVALESSRRELQRAERLLAVGAIPALRVQEARDRQVLASSRHSAAVKRLELFESTRRDEHRPLSDSTSVIRSHSDGVVTSVYVRPGAHVEKSQALLEVATTDTVHVVASVPEAHSDYVRTHQGAEIQFPLSERTRRAGPLVATGRLVDATTRTVDVTYEVENRSGELAIGQAVLLRLFMADSVEAPTVPSSSIVQRAGRSVAFVQTGGETFEERQIVLGNRASARVQVLSGLSEGERIVSRGAYLVRLASMSSDTPGHGHVH